MEVAKKLAAYDEMKAKADQAQQLHEEKENYRQLCEKMYLDGLIKQEKDGSFVAVEDPVERESIRSKTKQKMLEDTMSQASHVAERPEFEEPMLNEDGSQMQELK